MPTWASWVIKTKLPSKEGIRKIQSICIPLVFSYMVFCCYRLKIVFKYLFYLKEWDIDVANQQLFKKFLLVYDFRLYVFTRLMTLFHLVWNRRVEYKCYLHEILIDQFFAIGIECRIHFIKPMCENTGF